MATTTTERAVCLDCGGTLAPLSGVASCVRCGLVQSPLPAVLELLAAAAVFGRPFTLTELVLAAWARDPKRFGLPGEETWHPSDSRVRTMLYGTRGAIKRGLVRRLANGKYEITEKGRP